MENVDLHSHSRASDGLLAPAELVRRARDLGVTALALTDHDSTGGLGEAAEAARGTDLRFIPGVEISATWEGTTVHIVGLGIDAENAQLAQGLQWVRGGRLRRAGLIAESLAAVGIHGSLEGALGYAGSPEIVSRTHFGRFLVDRGYARDFRSVFQQYLVSGKPGYVPHQWAELGDAVRWIRCAGGVAVVAHPARYGMGSERMRRFIAEFIAHGGLGIEVMTANHTPDECAAFAGLAREFGLGASRGSDFHGPGESRVELGALPPLPGGLEPVWRAL